MARLVTGAPAGLFSVITDGGPVGHVNSMSQPLPSHKRKQHDETQGQEPQEHVVKAARHSAHPLQSAHRQTTERINLIVSGLENQLREHPGAGFDSLPAFQHLAGLTPEEKKGVVRHIMNDKACTLDLPGVFSRMNVGSTESECQFRREVISTLALRGELPLLARTITHFSPGEKDLPVLLAVSKKIARELPAALPGYLCLLHGHSGPDGVQPHPDFKPLPLPAAGTQDLVRDGLLNAPSYLDLTSSQQETVRSDFLHVSQNLGAGQPSAARHSRVPEFFAEICHEHAQSDGGLAAWLAYSAAHLNAEKLSEEARELLPDVYRDLARMSDPKLLYGCSQIIGKAMQDPQRADAFLTVDEYFGNKTLATLLFAATAENAELVDRLASVFCELDSDCRQYSEKTLGALADFAGSAAISPQTKRNLMAIYAQLLEPDDAGIDACRDMMRDLGRFCRPGARRSPQSSGAGMDIAPEEQEKAFFSALIQRNILRGKPGVGRLVEDLENIKYEDPDFATEVAPIIFSNEELRTFLKPAVRDWVRHSSVRQLGEMAGRVATDVLSDSLDGEILMEQKAMQEFSPTLSRFSELALAADNEPLCDWTQLAALMMLGVDQRLRESDQVTTALETIGNFRGEQSRFPATVCLHHCLQDQDAAGRLADFTVGLKDKQKIFAPALFLLMNKGEFSEQLEPLKKLVNNHRFRDTQKAHPLLSFIAEMALVKSLTPEEKCKLVSSLHEESSKARNGVSTSMAYVLGLAKLSDAGILESTQALEFLKTVQDSSGAKAAGKMLLKILFTVADAEIDSFFEKYEAYAARSRNPTALLSYATSIFMEFSDPELREAVIKEIALLGTAMADGEDSPVLQAARYGLEHNLHNSTLEAKSPGILKQWKKNLKLEKPIDFQPEDLDVKVDSFRYLSDRILVDEHVRPGTFPLLRRVLEGRLSVENALRLAGESHGSGGRKIERQLLLALRPGVTKQEALQALAELPGPMPNQQFAQDIKDLKKKLAAPPLSLEKCKSLRASISSDPEDLLLCGTEIIGSCQSVYGRTGFNASLPGYVLDGKYLSAQVTNANGTLMSRRMMRLLWSEEHNRPVIFIEREYSNPGVPKKIQDACLELIRQKARDIGALIASDDPDLIDESAPAAGGLHAYKTPRPLEYVDALTGIQKNGRYRIADSRLIRVSTVAAA